MVSSYFFFKSFLPILVIFFKNLVWPHPGYRMPLAVFSHCLQFPIFSPKICSRDVIIFLCTLCIVLIRKINLCSRILLFSFPLSLVKSQPWILLFTCSEFPPIIPFGKNSSFDSFQESLVWFLMRNICYHLLSNLQSPTKGETKTICSKQPNLCPQQAPELSPASLGFAPPPS